MKSYEKRQLGTPDRGQKPSEPLWTLMVYGCGSDADQNMNMGHEEPHAEVLEWACPLLLWIPCKLLETRHLQTLCSLFERVKLKASAGSLTLLCERKES